MGGTDVADLIELAYENKTPIYQYPVTKAYEMTSFFEGLLEYYRITGNERHKQAIMNLYFKGNVNFDLQSGAKIRLETQTDYPKTGLVHITVDVEMSERFTLLLRNPE